MLPLLEEALKSLTSRVNLSTGLGHLNDECAAKEIFKLLHKEGVPLLASDITAWAQANKWRPKDAEKLGDLAQHIGDGGRVVVKNKGMWADDILEQLKRRIL